MNTVLPMIRNPEKLRSFEREWIRKTPVNHEENRRLMEAGRELAVTVGVWPPENPLEGIDIVIRVARAFNVRQTST